MTKRYKLLKDLPDYKAGEIYEWNGDYYEAKTEPVTGGRGQWPAYYVENSPEWFEEIKKPETPFVWNDELIKEFSKLIIGEYFSMDVEQAMIKFKQSKQSAIADTVVREVNYGEVKYIHEKEFWKAIEDAFNAGRELWAKEFEPPQIQRKYATFQDYLNHIKQ